MKLGNKISFGVQAVQAGQKSSTVNAAPQLIANSTRLLTLLLVKT